MPGIVSDADLPVLISGAQVFVYSSFFEGFGLPVLEAMACGTPVVSSNATSLPEVVGEAALMVTPGKVEELVQALRQVLQSSVLRQQLRERGLQRAKLFSWERTAQETLRVYQMVAKKERPAIRDLKT
jgi:glycosyltransferase involved in cell wall biosynthesis